MSPPPPTDPDEEEMDISDDERKPSQRPLEPASMLPPSTAYNPYADAYGPYAYYYQGGQGMMQSSHYSQPPIQPIYHPYARPSAMSYAQSVKKSAPNAPATKIVAPVAYTPISISVSTAKKPLLKPVAKPATLSKWDVPAPSASAAANMASPLLPSSTPCPSQPANVAAQPGAASSKCLPDSSSSTSEVWPDSLKVFVHAAFASCAESEKSAMESRLKELILASVKNRTLQSTDWAKMPIPIVAQPLSVAAPEKKTKIKVKTRTKANSEAKDKLSRLSVDEETWRKTERSKRFTATQKDHLFPRPASSDSPLPVSFASLGDREEFWDSMTIVGTSTRLEKSYFRLTSAPDPGTVRPLPVLRAALEALCAKYRDASGPVYDNYVYFNDQMKAIRQDLTVQRARTLFTVHVYEIHGRAAILKGDLGEYHQCQTQLDSLYQELCVAPETDSSDELLDNFKDLAEAGHPMEFLAYRILYYTFTSQPTQLLLILARLKEVQQKDSRVSLALRIRKSVALENYAALFQLYQTECRSAMMKRLVEHFLGKERVKAFYKLALAYRPTLSISFIASVLGFDEESEARLWLLEEFDAGLVWLEQSSLLDIKASLDAISEKCTRSLHKIDIKGQI